jgi:hypothetical protein
MMENSSNKSNYEYILLISFDQGSKKLIFNPLYDTKSDNIMQSLLIPLILVILGLLILVGFAIYLRYFKKYYGQQFIEEERERIKLKFLNSMQSPRELTDLVNTLMLLNDEKKDIDDVYRKKGYMKSSDYIQLNKEIEKIIYIILQSQNYPIKSIKDHLFKMVSNSTIELDEYVEIYDEIINFERSQSLRE